MKFKTLIALVIIIAVGAGLVYFLTRSPQQIVLTGMVTTDQVLVSPEIQGRLEQLLVSEGDTVAPGQLVAVIEPKELKADLDFYASNAEQTTAQVAESEAQLKFQEAQLSSQIRQAEANLGAARAQLAQAEADLEEAKLTFQREDDLYRRGVDAKQLYDQARTARDAAEARVDSLKKQVQAAEASVTLAETHQDQVVAQRAAVQATRKQVGAASAQQQKARVRLGYTEIRAPIGGIVDKRISLQGEVVNPGQAIVTLIDPDGLWVRADVEETYIDRIRLGDKLKVTLPSGAQREGTVFYRAVDADYATQRDVSRTKRDIKTFEIRLRCDNHDRGLAVGMTVYVTLPLQAQ
ncbi:MAG: efflux RND transporter periplasmic adaptor subunit [Acidobacteriota bacterium]